MQEYLSEVKLTNQCGFRSSFLCQGTSTRRQRSDLCGLPFECWTSSREAVNTNF